MALFRVPLNLGVREVLREVDARYVLRLAVQVREKAALRTVEDC